MTMHNLAQVGLQLRLWLMRFGIGNILATLLLATACGVWLFAVPQLQKDLGGGKSALTAAQKALSAAPTLAVAELVPQAEQHLQQFYDALGDSRYAEQQVKTLFAIAAKNGLTLNQAEYKFAYEKSGKFHTYAITLPVKGPYTAVRPFCEQVLLAIPFASLDGVDFKREAVSNSNLDAKLHFTLHLDNGNGADIAEAVGQQGGER